MFLKLYLAKNNKKIVLTLITFILVIINIKKLQNTLLYLLSGFLS